MMKVKVNKPKLNLVIDMIMFILLLAIAGIGFLIKYILIPGFKRNAVYGSDVDLFFWGIDRHQWGTIHLILGLILVFLLLLHIILHWKQVTCIFKRKIEKKSARLVFVALFSFISLAFIIVPFLIKPEVEQRSRTPHGSYHLQGSIQYEQNHYQPTVQNPREKPGNFNMDDQNHHSPVEFCGKMTLRQVARKYHIPENDLADAIGVPPGHTTEKLGRLKKIHGFEMYDLRAILTREIKDRTQDGTVQ